MIELFRAARRVSLAAFLVAVVASSALATPEDAAQDADATRVAAAQAASEADLKEALAELKLASDFLAAQKAFHFRAFLGFDVLQSTGQKIEFGATRDVTIVRPNHVFIDAMGRDGDHTLLYFDGKAISIDFPQDDAYVSVKKPGSIDQAIDYLVEDLRVPAPLADLMYSDFYAGVADKIQGGFVVGSAQIGEFETVHLAFTGKEVDAQLWIRTGEKPVPFRMVITYKNAEGSPQFWAQFLDWDLDFEVPDGTFVFEAPEGAELIPISIAVQDVREATEGQ